MIHFERLGTDIDAGVYKGSPCVWIDYSTSLVLKLESMKKDVINSSTRSLWGMHGPSKFPFPRFNMYVRP